MRQLIVNSSEFIVNELRAMILCFLSGVILTLPFNNAKFWVFAWIGFVPLFFALEKKSKGKAFLLSYLAGVIFWLATIYWLIHVTLPGMILLILYLALYFGIFGIFISTINYNLSTINFLLMPSTWVLLEYIRSHLFTGFPWAVLGYSQYQNLPIIQVADITGVWGVSFLLMMVNAVIYTVVSHKLSAVSKKQEYFLFLIILFVVLVYGYFKIYSLGLKAYSLKLKVSVIQGNVPQELKWMPSARTDILHKYFKLTEEVSKTQPDLIVWPEASSPGILGEDDLVFREISALSKEIKSHLLIGAVSMDDGKYFNSALLIKPSARIAGRYDKLHLVPFGEYIPLKKFLPFLETVVPIGDITPGRDYTIFTLPTTYHLLPTKFSVLICFEDLFPVLSREFVKRGADFLINITNDAWYKKTSAAYQHLEASVFRAVENRVFLVRSANTGVSGFIKPDGKIISKVRDRFGRDIFISGIDTQELTILNKSFTIYTRYGDFFPFACLLFVLYSIIPFFKSKR